MPQILVPKLEEVKVGREVGKVVLYTKSATIKLPWQVVKAVAKAMLIQAGREEEMANLPRLIQDQALLQRTGAPFGLTDHPDIQEEAMKTAQHDDKLRKYLPGGVKGTAKLGVPRVIKHDPPKKEGTNGKKV